MRDYAGYGNYSYDGMDDEQYSMESWSERAERERREKEEAKQRYELMLMGVSLKKIYGTEHMTEKQKYDAMLSKQR